MGQFSPYRQSVTPEAPRKIEYKTYSSAIDDVVVTVYDINGRELGELKFDGDNAPIPGPDGVVVFVNRHSGPTLFSGSCRLREFLSKAAANKVFDFDNTRYVPWHMIGDVRVSKRTVRQVEFRYMYCDRP